MLRFAVCITFFSLAICTDIVAWEFRYSVFLEQFNVENSPPDSHQYCPLPLRTSSQSQQNRPNKICSKISCIGTLFFCGNHESILLFEKKGWSDQLSWRDGGVGRLWEVENGPRPFCSSSKPQKGPGCQPSSLSSTLFQSPHHLPHPGFYGNPKNAPGGWGGVGGPKFSKFSRRPESQKKHPFCYYPAKTPGGGWWGTPDHPPLSVWRGGGPGHPSSFRSRNPPPHRRPPGVPASCRGPSAAAASFSRPASPLATPHTTHSDFARFLLNHTRCCFEYSILRYLFFLFFSEKFFSKVMSTSESC